MKSQLSKQADLYKVNYSVNIFVRKKHCQTIWNTCKVFIYHKTAYKCKI